MKAIFNYIKDIFSGLATLWAGLKITSGYFVRPREIITRKYPENRKQLEMFERYKGEIIMVHDSENYHRCTACGICQLNCPNGTIEVVSRKELNSEGKEVRVLDRHIYNLGMCTFCGLCIKTCPSNALAFGHNFENAVFNKSVLIKTLNKPGSYLKKQVK